MRALAYHRLLVLLALANIIPVHGALYGYVGFWFRF